jgi:WS/DGAT/MGAT family acyltransferase
MKKLSGQDALFLHMDRPHAASHVTMIYVYDQSGLARPLRFRQIVGHLAKRLDVSPMFRNKIVQPPLAYPYWASDPGFDIDFHVRHFALPKPGDWRQFQIMAARIHARPLDLMRPPWEMYVIEGLDNVDWLPKGSFALITKVHHAAVDGTAMAELTWALHDVLGAKGKATPVLAKQKNVVRQEATSTFLDTISRIVVDNVAAPLKLAGPVARALPVVDGDDEAPGASVVRAAGRRPAHTLQSTDIEPARIRERGVRLRHGQAHPGSGSRHDCQRRGARNRRRSDAPLSRKQEGTPQAVAGRAGAGQYT